MTSVRRICRYFFLSALASATLPAVAIEPATGRHTIVYASSGPGRPDGYENAQVNVQYQFTDCPGAITLGFRLIPGSASVSPRYWHDGAQIVPSEAAPAVGRVEFVADVMYRGSRIARLSFLNNHHVSTGSQLGCGGLTVGRFPDFLPKGYTEADKIQMFRELVIWTDTSPNTLTNPAIRQRLQRERREAEAQRAAAERKAAAARAEAERAEQAAREAAAGAQAAGAPATPGATAAGRLPPRGGQGPGAQPPAGAPQPRPQPSGGRPAMTDAQRHAALAAERLERQRRLEQQQAARRIDQGARNIASHLALESAARDTGRRIASLTRLSEGIDSIEQLEAEFERRRAEINETIDAYASQQQAATSTMHRAFDDRAVGMATQNFVAAVQQYSTNNARNEALAELEQERQRMWRQLEQRRHQALLQGRQLLLDEFQDGALPRYADRVPGGVVYCFAYSLNPADIALTGSSPPVYITPVFPVAQRGDGGWPLRQRLDAELAQVMPPGRPVTLAGYFLSEREAAELRDAFIRIAGQSRLALTELAFDSRLGRRAGAVANFWSDAAPASGAAAEAVDFWGEGAAPDTSAKPAPAADEHDFWR